MTTSPDAGPIIVRVAQLSRDDLHGLSAEQIVGARKAGRLAVVMGQEVPIDWPATYAARTAAADERPSPESEAVPPVEPKALTRDDLRKLSPGAIAKLHEMGDLDHLLGIRRPPRRRPPQPTPPARRRHD